MNDAFSLSQRELDAWHVMLPVFGGGILLLGAVKVLQTPGEVPPGYMTGYMTAPLVFAVAVALLSLLWRSRRSLVSFTRVCSKALCAQGLLLALSVCGGASVEPGPAPRGPAPLTASPALAEPGPVEFAGQEIEVPYGCELVDRMAIKCPDAALFWERYEADAPADAEQRDVDASRARPDERYQRVEHVIEDVDTCAIRRGQTSSCVVRYRAELGTSEHLFIARAVANVGGERLLVSCRWAADSAEYGGFPGPCDEVFAPPPADPPTGRG